MSQRNRAIDAIIAAIDGQPLELTWSICAQSINLIAIIISITKQSTCY